MTSFKGFQSVDFRKSIEGTNWRAMLGRALGASVSQPGQQFKSRAIDRESTITIYQERHFDAEDKWPYAKLFVHASSSEILYGLWIESTDAEGKVQPETRKKPPLLPGDFAHWRKFQNRLRSDPELRQALETAMAIPGMTISDCFRQDTGGALRVRFALRDGRWQASYPDTGKWQEIEYDRMVERIAGLPRETWVDFHIFAATAKDEAIALKEKVKDPIATVLCALVPVYQRIVR